LGQHRHKNKEGEEGKKKKRNLKDLDVVRNRKECVFFQAKDPPFALFCGNKKART
jgi:hypothetical protein